jgi:ABC-three component (ABC-3C) system Middle Component 2
MDQAVGTGRKPATFNGPLEAGVRAVAVLCAAHPQSFDLQRLIAFDYLLVHTGDIGGPESLHPPVPLQSAELLVRRKLVEQALLLMMTRDLVRFMPIVNH